MLRPTWDPSADVATLRDQVNRLFDESVPRGGRERREGMPQRAWAPAVDIFEDKDKIMLKADLPGLSQDQINIELEGDTLTIRGERRLDDQGQPTCLRSERIAGPFVRSFTLATPVDVNKVSAAYKEGVLEVVIPKAEETKPRRIQISTGQPVAGEA